VASVGQPSNGDELRVADAHCMSWMRCGIGVRRSAQIPWAPEVAESPMISAKTFCLAIRGFRETC